MEKQTLYCETKFLSDFFNLRPKESSGVLISEERIEVWRNYINLIFDNNLLLDISADEFSKIPNHDVWNMLKKQKMDGRIKIKFDKFPIKFNEVDSHSIFFLADLDKCYRLEIEQGMLFITTENIYEKAQFLFSHDGFRTINTKNDWNVLSNFKHPCNSMLFIDNYIFKNKKKENVVKNFKILFNTLMPASINKAFKIQIITLDPNKKKPNENAFNEWEDKTKEDLENFIIDIVKTIRREIKLDVEIKFVEYSEHDRHLITNYCWFSCGYGFILDYAERVKGTDVHIHRIISPNVKARVSELIGKVRTNK